MILSFFVVFLQRFVFHFLEKIFSFLVDCTTPWAFQRKASELFGVVPNCDPTRVVTSRVHVESMVMLFGHGWFSNNTCLGGNDRLLTLILA